MGSEKGAGRSVLAVQHYADDNDISLRLSNSLFPRSGGSLQLTLPLVDSTLYIYIYIYILNSSKMVTYLGAGF